MPESTNEKPRYWFPAKCYGWGWGTTFHLGRLARIHRFHCHPLQFGMAQWWLRCRSDRDCRVDSRCDVSHRVLER